MSKADYRLVESFQIDEGQLNGLSPQECFVLGYELALISCRAENEHEEFSVMVHADNEHRITTALIKRGRSRIITWSHDDVSEEWVKLTVLARNTTSD